MKREFVDCLGSSSSFAGSSQSPNFSNLKIQKEKKVKVLSEYQIGFMKLSHCQSFVGDVKTAGWWISLYWLAVIVRLFQEALRRELFVVYLVASERWIRGYVALISL